MHSQCESRKVSTWPVASDAPIRRALIRPTRSCARRIFTGTSKVETYSSNDFPKNSAHNTLIIIIISTYDKIAFTFQFGNLVKNFPEVTSLASVVDQDDLPEKSSGRSIDHTDHSPKKRRKSFVVIDNDHTGVRQLLWIG